MTVIDDFRMDGHVCVVTGGGRGIGEGIALCMAEAGADVVVAARRKDDLENVVQKIEDRGRRGLAVPIDLMEENAVRELVNTAVSEFGKISIWVNNAGGSDATETYYIDETPVDYWEWMIRFNLTIPFEGAKLAIPHIPEHGSIINIVSGAGLNAAPHTGAYGAAKAGVINMTMTLAEELGTKRIRVNAIAPGPIVTEQFSEMFPMTEEDQKKYGDYLPTGRMGKPEDIGAACVWLASEAGSWVTGQTIAINGGHIPGSIGKVLKG